MKGLSLLTATMVALPMVSGSQVLASDTHTNILSIERAAALFSDGLEVYIYGYGTENHLAVRTTTTDEATTTDVAASDAISYLSIWTLEKAPSTSATDTSSEIYYIKNSLTGLYLGKTSTSLSDQKIQLTSDKADAGRYRVGSRSVGDVTYVKLTDIEGGSYPLLKVSDDGELVNGSNFPGTDTKTVDGRCFTLSSDLDADKTTLAKELIAVYNDNYIGTYTDDNTGEQFDFIGDLEPTSEETTMLGNLMLNPTSTECYVAFKSALDADLTLPMTSSRRLQFKEGHYYHIESPYGYYTKQALAETYYTKDYSNTNKAQRVHFKAWNEYNHYSVPTFWKFVEQDKRNGKYDNYYKIVAANSGKAMRRTGASCIIDMQDVNDSFVGIYSTQKESDLLVYGHSVTLISNNNDENRSSSSRLATYKDSEFDDDYDLREGNELCPATDQPVSGANNWRIHEVTRVKLYFPQPTKTTELDAYGNAQTVDYSGSCYRSLYLPFAVKVPEGVTAYSVLDKLSVYGENAFELAKITFTDGTKDIIPANTPAIVVGQGDKTYTFPILYDDTHSPVIFSLMGSATPKAVDNGDVVYVVDDLSDETGHTSNFIRKIGGTDYSYDTGVTDTARATTDKATTKPAYSIIDSDATYILDANHAYLQADDENEPAYKGALNGNRVTTSNLDITVNRPTVNPEDMKYYDLNGRRVERPSHGIFIREDGVKILIP